MSSLETISAEVLNVLYWAWKPVQSKCLIFYIWHGNYFSRSEKNSVLIFVHFRRGRIGALRKKLLEHFTAIFGILNE